MKTKNSTNKLLEDAKSLLEEAKSEIDALLRENAELKKKLNEYQNKESVSKKPDKRDSVIHIDFRKKERV